MKNVFDFDYNNSILSASNSILKHYGIQTYHKTHPFLDEKLKSNKKNGSIILMLHHNFGTDLIPKTIYIPKAT